MTEPGGDEMITREDAISAVALIPTEDLVTAVSGQEHPHAGLPRQTRAEIHGERGIVAEGLIVCRYEIRQALQSLIGRDDLGIVSDVKMARGQLGVVELVVAGLLEADGEGMNPLGREPAHEAHYGAAVRASTQERTRVLGLQAAEGLPHGLLGPAADSPGGRQPPQKALGIRDIPILVQRRAAVLPGQRLPWCQSRQATVDSLRTRDRTELSV